MASTTSAIKDGKLKYYSGNDWKDVYAALSQDSTFTWGENSLKLKDVAPYIAMGPYTEVVPNRPAVPKGATAYHLLAIGTGPNATVHWFLFDSDDDMKEWMDKIVSTLPQQPQQPPNAPQADNRPPPYAPSVQADPIAQPGYYPQQPPSVNYGPQGPVGGYAPPPPQYQPAPPPPASNTTVIIKDKRPYYGSGSGIGTGLGFGAVGLGTGLLVGYGLGEMTHPHYATYFCGSGWGGSPTYFGGTSIQQNETTIVNNYNYTDDRTTTNEYNNTDNNFQQTNFNAGDDDSNQANFGDDDFDDGNNFDDQGDFSSDY